MSPADEEGPRVSRLRFGDDELVVVSVPQLDVRAAAALTGAERQVVHEVLVGRSNADIARRRGGSPRTVANHLANVFRKLGVSSRAELALRLFDPER
jgi:DNA-binding CsgD family transcriptional regulator